MKFTITATETLPRWLHIGRQGTWVPLDDATPDEQRGALRAIAEHLGPDATIAALGTDANAKQFADAQTREAIRAAGYDPDEVGAEQVIRELAVGNIPGSMRHRITTLRQQRDTARQAQREAVSESQRLLERAERAEQEIKYLRSKLSGARNALLSYGCTDPWSDEEDAFAATNFRQSIRELADERDTARANADEWRDQLTNARNGEDTARAQLRALADERDRLLSELKAFKQIAADEIVAIKRLRQRLVELKSEPESLRREIQRWYDKLEASDNERDAALKRVDYLEAKLSECESADAEHVTQLQEAQAQKAALRKRVKELEAELSRWRAAGEHLGGRLGLPDGPDAVAEALRQYVAAEDALGDRHDHETYQLSEAVRDEVEDATDAREALIAAGEDPEEYDDGFGGAVARLLQRAERAETDGNPFGGLANVRHDPPEHSTGAPRYVSEDEDRRIQDAVDGEPAGDGTGRAPAPPSGDTPEAIARDACREAGSHFPDEQCVIAPAADRIRALVEKAEREGRIAELRFIASPASGVVVLGEIAVGDIDARRRELEAKGGK